MILSGLFLLASCGGPDAISAVISAASIAPGSTTSLVSLTGAAVTELPSVVVKDKMGRPVPGVVVTFALTGGGGSVSGATQTTNSSGVATLGGWTLGTSPGSNTVTASVGSLSPVTFTVTSYPSALGTIVLTTNTTASATSDLDPDGYAVAIDANPQQPIGINEIVGQSIPSGTHTFVLSGVKSNCTVLGGPVRQVTVLLSALTSITFDILCVSPAQRTPMLAYVAEINGNSDIYIGNIDGTGQVRLTNDIAADFDPAWSPDGTRIAFVSNRTNPGPGLYIMAADGSGVARCVNMGSIRNPAWSPDGRTIAFSAPGTSFETDIYTVNPGDCAGAPKRITTNASGPAWSADGLHLAFSSNRRTYDSYYEMSNTPELFLMNADGSNVRQIIPLPPDGGPGTMFYDPAWSPDGRRIALSVCVLVSNACSQSGGIGIANSDGTALKVLNGTDYGSHPTWSPDGSTIAFSAGGTIRYVRATGSSSGAVIPTGHSPSWRP